MVFYPGHGFSRIIVAPVPALGDKQVEQDDFFMPSVLLWNPYLIHPQFVPPGSVKCAHCGNYMDMAFWNDGSSESKQPRVLQGTDNIVLLVSAVYTCDKGHKVLANDEKVLDKFPSNSVIPFHLLHRTGLTRKLVDMCTLFCRQGINFYRMESIILEWRWMTYARQQKLYEIHRNMCAQPPVTADFLSSILSKSPSNNILSKCFLTSFLSQEDIYLSEMESIPAGESISFDHTFKVASNIGYLREDGKWINEYDGLFIVLNPEGKVLTWQLTKGTSFAHVERLLQDLVQRSAGKIHTVYVDDCCKLRAKIRSLLGSNVSVKLDLFHAVQRTTRTLSRKHALTRQCMEDFRLVFRCDGDSGINRLSATPSPDQISSKLDVFVAKWKDASDSKGTKLFKAETLASLHNLKQHITAGCLSYIPPGGGTNKNERLHEHLKTFFHRSRIGILLAYALLTVIFHTHNTSQKVGGKVVIRPITASPLQGIPTGKKASIGIMPKDQLRQRVEHGSEHWEIDVSTAAMDLGTILPIYHRALEKLQIVRGLSKIQLPHLRSTVQHFQQFQASAIAVTADVDPNLKTRLDRYGLILSPIIADGNCFFRAVSANILANLSEWTHIISSIGISGNDITASSLSTKLREMFVSEVTGHNRTMYEGFLLSVASDFDYIAEARKFLQNGFFASSFGDFMPSAMATILQSSIVILVTTTLSDPPLYVVPVQGSAEHTIFLVYTPTGPGHYDAAIPYYLTTSPTEMTDSDKVSMEDTAGCRCGNSKKISTNSCIPSALYTTRCKCHAKSQPCSSKCKCKDCANPFGVRPQNPGGVRKRQRHSFQWQLPSSKKFALDRKEALGEHLWSDFESIVLNEILLQEHVDVTELFNSIVEYSKCAFCTSPLDNSVIFREKTTSQVNSKIESTQRL